VADTNPMVAGNSNGNAELLRRKLREWVAVRSAEQNSEAISGAIADSIVETTLVRKGAYVGRRFSLGGLSLIWFVQQGQVWLVGPDGKELASEDFWESNQKPSNDSSDDQPSVQPSGQNKITTEIGNQ
jgi:hypothetical protein